MGSFNVLVIRFFPNLQLLRLFKKFLNSMKIDDIFYSMLCMYSFLSVWGGGGVSKLLLAKKVAKRLIRIVGIGALQRQNTVAKAMIHSKAFDEDRSISIYSACLILS